MESDDDFEEELSGAYLNLARSRKRDLEQDSAPVNSQQSILKWARKFPGPIQEVMQRQPNMTASTTGTADTDIPSSHLSSQRVQIATVFDDGAWVDMCSYLKIPTSRGELYGGVRISSLKNTVSYITEDDQSTPKVSQLLVLIKSMRYVEEAITAVFHDPTGEIEGYLHRRLVERIGSAMIAGVGLILEDVSVFTPSEDTTVSGRSKSYLNIVERNVRRVFLPSSATGESIVASFNKEKAQMVASKTVDASVEVQKQVEVEPRTRVPSVTFDTRSTKAPTLRNQSTELSFFSQRQVVHRNPPANPSTGLGSGKNKKKAKEQNWNWHLLLQKPDENKNKNKESQVSFQEAEKGIDHRTDAEQNSTMGKSQGEVSVGSIPQHLLDEADLIEDDEDW